MKRSLSNIGPLLAVLLALVGAGAALYWPCLDGPLIWDDRTFVAMQPFLLEPSNLLAPVSASGLGKVLPVRGVARPLWLSSVLADRAVFGGGVRAHRLVNILWHAAAAWMLLGLMISFGAGLPAAAVGTSLFLAHPLHAETVVMVTYRADLMAFTFIVAAAWLVHESPRLARGARAAALACVGLALLSKEIAVLSPLLLYCAEAPRPDPRRRLFYAGLGGLLALYALFVVPRAGYRMADRSDVLTIAYRGAPAVFSLTAAPLRPQAAPVLPDLGDPPPWSEGQSVAARIVSGFRAQGRALLDVVWPLDLPTDPASRPARGLLDFTACAAALGLGGLLLAAWRLRTASPGASAGLAWIPISLLPFLGLTAVPNLRGDRYLLFATAGVALAACGAISRTAPGKRRRAALVAGLLVAGGWALATRARLVDYADDEAFYRATLARDPDSPRARLGSAIDLAAAGSPEAESEFRRAVSAWPGSRNARLFLAHHLAATRRYGEALSIFEALLAENPEDDATRWRLAMVFAAADRPREAVRILDALASRLPDYWPAERESGCLLLRLGEPGEAVARLRAASSSGDRETFALLQAACRRAGRARGVPAGCADVTGVPAAVPACSVMTWGRAARIDVL